MASLSCVVGDPVRRCWSGVDDVGIAEAHFLLAFIEIVPGGPNGDFGYFPAGHGQLFHAGDAVSVLGIPGQIDRLQRVVFDVVELADVFFSVDVLEALIPHHAAGIEAVVVLGENACLYFTAGEGGGQVFSFDEVGHGNIEEVEQGGHQVDVADHGVRDGGFGQVAGQGEDEGYADGIFEEGVFFADAVFVEHLAVVAGVDDQGVFAQSLFFEPVDDAPDTVVEVGDKAVVGGDGSADHFLGQVPEFVVVDAFDYAPGFIGKTDVVVGQIADVVGIVHGMKTLRGAPGRMRGSVADVSEERFLGVSPVEEFETLISYQRVPHLVFGVGKRLALHIAVGVFPHFGDNVGLVVALLDFVACLFPVAPGVAVVGGETEFGERISPLDVLVGVHKAGPVGDVAGVAQVGYEGVDAGLDEFSVGFAGAVPTVVVSNRAVGMWVGTGNPGDAGRTAKG